MMQSPRGIFSWRQIGIANSNSKSFSFCIRAKETARVLEDANLQHELRAQLAERAEHFSPEKFGDYLRCIVAKFLEDGKSNKVSHL